MKYVLAMTGASGAAYALRLLEVLLAAGRDVHLVLSPAAVAVLKTEIDVEVSLDHFQLAPLLAAARARLSAYGAAAPLQSGRVGAVEYHHHQNLLAPISSGSALTRGMVVCPCSGGTMSAIAHASSTNLIHRAADVHLKERRPLLLVPRETPLSAIQLENMQRCAQAGAIVLPAMPGWYHQPQSLADLIDFVVSRICDQLGIENSLARRWGQSPAG